MKIKKYDHFLILEKFDDNIKLELKRLGVTDPKKVGEYLYAAHRGHLAEYMNDNGKEFTFGLLNAIFKDSLRAKKMSELEIGAIKMAHRLIPMALAPFFPILAMVGYILGTSRAFNKIMIPIWSGREDDENYTSFLKKIIDGSMKIAEGEIPIKDRFSRAFVVSDRLVDAIKPDVLHKFSLYLSKKMSEENPDSTVPEFYIENELKSYLNNNFEIYPEIPLKEI